MVKIRIRTELYAGTVPATKKEFARNFESWCPKLHSSTLSKAVFCNTLPPYQLENYPIPNPIFRNLSKCFSFKGISIYVYLCLRGSLAVTQPECAPNLMEIGANSKQNIKKQVHFLIHIQPYYGCTDFFQKSAHFQRMQSWCQ